MEKARAQQIVVDETTDQIAGDPIFSHGVGYAGMVVYDGEEIPWFVLSDVYIFNPLVFKNERQAKKYYKIAANIKKVYFGCRPADAEAIGFRDRVFDEKFGGRQGMEEYLMEVDREACLKLFEEYNSLEAQKY